MARTPYIWSYVSVCLTRETSVSEIDPETCSQVFWSPHQGANLFLLDLKFYVDPEPPGARKLTREPREVSASDFDETEIC